MRYSVVTSALLGAIVALAGCGSRASDEPAKSEPPVTAGSRSAIATAISLDRYGVRRDELPADFRTVGAASGRTSATRADLALQRCASPAALRPVAGATSITYGSSYGEVRSATERFRTQRDVTDVVAVLKSRDATRCFGRWFAVQRADFTNDDSAPLSSSVTVRPGTNDGPRNAAGVASADYRFRGNGADHTVSVGVYYLTGPLLLTRLIVTKFGGDAFDRHLNGVLFPLAARTAAG